MSGPVRFHGVHPLFLVRDVVRTAEHYRDVLGFQIGKYFGDPPSFTHVKRGPVFLQLSRAPSDERATRSYGPTGFNAYIWVSDVDALHAEYRDRGAEIVEPPTNREYGCREMSVADCNGLVLCFSEDLSRGNSGSAREARQ